MCFSIPSAQTLAPPLRIVVADDHPLVREGVRVTVAARDQVIAEAGSGTEALRLVEQLAPDVLICDISMPGLNGLELVRELRARQLAVRVILLTMHDNEDVVSEALRLGVAGYLLKTSGLSELATALEALRQGQVHLSAKLMPTITRALQTGRGALTDRQTDILRLVALGLSSKEIARKLELSVKTVESHRSQIMDRLGLHDLANLVRYAVRIGLIEPH